MTAAAPADTPWRTEEMLSMRDVCALVGLSAETVADWVARGCCIGIVGPQGGLHLPRWQFHPRVLKALPKVSAALGLRDGRQLLAYLETPAPALGGTTPRRLIEQGRTETVLELAVRRG
jgi:hypothetical protein